MAMDIGLICKNNFLGICNSFNSKDSLQSSNNQSPSPAPKPSPAPSPIPVPKSPPAPTPKPSLVCNYSMKDKTSYAIRTAILSMPSACQKEINLDLYYFDHKTAVLAISVMPACQTSLKSLIKTYAPSLNTTKCANLFFYDANIYINERAGNIVNFLPDNACLGYLDSFIDDYFKHPTNSATLGACSASAT